MIAEVKDGLNFFSKLSLRKVLNYISLLLSYKISGWTKKNVHLGMPFSVSYEPTTSCNLRCPECPSGLRSFTRPTGMLALESYKKTIEELAPHLAYLTLYFQGEPYLHPSFFDLATFASKKRIYTSTSTNGHYLTEEIARKTVESGLDRLIISIDGTTQETYEAYRVGGRLSKVLEGTRHVTRWKKKLKSSTPYVIFQFLVVGPNEHQIGEVKELARELGVDKVLYKTAQIYNYKEGSPLIPRNDKYSRYALGEDGAYHLKSVVGDNCWKMWHSCVITWDGKVVPCCFDKDGQYTLGALQDTSFKAIWKNQAYDQFRKSLLRGRDQIEICRNCTEGAKVWA